MGLTAKEVESTRNDKLGPKVAEALKKRRFDAWYFSSREDAVNHLFSLIPADHVVSWGGSLTMEELGIQKMAREKCKVLDRDTGKTPEERNELMRKALTCDTYITGVNAVSEDGQLVNIDGYGNRVAAMIYGPRQVIVIAGMNKVAKTLEDALVRARTIAAPLNQQRFPGRNSPCALNGACSNCTSTDCICTYIVTTRISNPA
ncbi:MAG: lactate utilization protein, partial [Treponema sp.]|nr:lactate utilization protein [Treponema sp.]